MTSESIYAPKNIAKVDIVDSRSSPEEEIPPTNPYLTRPQLSISGIDRNTSDRDLANGIFQPFVPVRIQIDRSDALGEKVRGTVDFKTVDQAERALATIKSPHLSINQDISSDPKPSAKPRLVKQLPHGAEDVDVYDIFRPYGPVASAERVLTSSQGQHTGYRGMAVVTYYHEEDAQKAQADLHCAEVDGKTISVIIDTARRPSGQAAPFSAAAAPFVPGSSMTSIRQMNATAPVFQPPQRSSSGLTPSTSFASNSASQQGGPTVSVPGTHLHYSASAATYIDPCNLFCKNLDPSIDSNLLFNLFTDFGKIISARVMRDDNGVSREFGFVSYANAEDANRALRAMNQAMVGSKMMTVRLHEPKNIRQEKLSHKFGSSYNGPIDSPNEGGPSSEANVSSRGTRSPSLDRRQDRRLSNSYFEAAANEENGLGHVDLEQLETMSSSVRNDVLKGEFSRKIQAGETVQKDQVDDMASKMSKMALPDATTTLNDPGLLTQRVKGIQMQGQSSSTSSPPISASMTPQPSAGSERERILTAVTALVPAESSLEDITDLLVQLPRKERAMALFNQEYLRKKVAEAKAIIEMADDDDDEPHAAPTPLTKENIALASQSLTHDSSRPSESTKAYTLKDLAKMPAIEIIKLAKSSQAAGLPLPKADAQITKDTDAFIDDLQNLPLTDQKQKVGDQLFKKVRTFGVKGAPKITIALLDGEDLRSLAHLMNSYPDCLREKVSFHTLK